MTTRPTPSRQEHRMRKLTQARTLLRVLLWIALSQSATGLAAGLGPVIQLRAKVGELLLEEGNLKVEVGGFYLNDQLPVKINLYFETRRRCTGKPLQQTCGNTYTDTEIQDVEDTLAAIDAAEAAVKTGKSFSRRFKMDASPCCVPTWGEVSVATGRPVAAFRLGYDPSTFSFSTDDDQLLALRSALTRANDLRAHLQPQLDAFNRTPPDRSNRIEDVPDISIQASDVRLSFKGVKGAGYSFLLENNSRLEIGYRADGKTPVDSQVACKAADSATPDDAEYGIVDGAFSFVRVAPGKSQLFSVPDHDFLNSKPYAVRYPKGRCRLTLHLDNSKSVLSDEFTP